MKMKVRDNLNWLLATACVLGLSATTVDAAPVWLTPDADARLSNDSNRGPTSSTGSSSDTGGQVWEVRWHEAPRVRIGYIRYDITGVDPALYDTATIKGTFADSSRNGPTDGTGIWNVYGLNDDVLEDGMGRQGNDWDEATVNYSNAAGVDNSAALGTFEILASETALLGTLSLTGEDEQPLPFSSNTTDLPLGDFLREDTDGLVTFLFMSVSQDGHEYRIDSKEGNTADGHGPTMLHFVPEPSSIALLGIGIVGLWLRRRRM